MDATRDLIWFKLGDAYRCRRRSRPIPRRSRSAFRKPSTITRRRLNSSRTPWRTGKKRSQRHQESRRLLQQHGRRLQQGRQDRRCREDLSTRRRRPIRARRRSRISTSARCSPTPAKCDDAIAAFDKCIAADPTKADAYYQKGVNLIGKATLQGDKMVAPPGTAEAFQKYLELAAHRPSLPT